MYSSIFNVEWAQIFGLQMLYVMNCKKINKCIGNQQCNRHLHFPGQFTVFNEFSRLFHTYDHFQGFSKFQDFPQFSRICTNPVVLIVIYRDFLCYMVYRPQGQSIDHKVVINLS